MPIFCRQDRCKSSFNTIFNFFTHIKSYHETYYCHADEAEHPCTSISVLMETDDPYEDVSEMADVMPDVMPAVTEHDFLLDIQNEGVSLVAGLRANSSIPYGVIPGIAESFNNMASSLTSFIHAEVISSLSSTGIDKNVIHKVTDSLDEKLGSCHKPLDFLSSRYRIDSYFAAHPLLVAPEPIQYVPRLESHGGSSGFVYDQFQYVSVKKTLSSLLQNRSYVEALLEDKCEPGVLLDFADGSRYKEHFLFGDRDRFSIMLQLFYDGLGVTNPLRSQGSAHNVGVFYYTIKNLPQQFNSCFAIVHLLALSYAHDLAVYFEKILFSHQGSCLSLGMLERVFGGGMPFLTPTN